MNYLKSLLSGLLLLGILAVPVQAKDIEDASCWSETAASNTCSSPDGWAANQAPSSIYANLKELMGAVKRAWDRDHATLSSTGSANAYVLTYTAAPAAYAKGQRYAFVSNFANTGSATVNVNALGAVTIQKQTASGLANLSSGDIFSGQHVTLEYDSGASVFVLLNPQAGGSGGGGGVTSVTAGTGLSGGTITGVGTISLTAPVTVNLGGTGVTTLSAHGVLLGNGTSAVNLASPGTAGQVLTSNGGSADPTMQAAVTGSGSVTQQVFTSTGTYTPNAHMAYAILECVGGGGGGGGVADPSGGIAAAGGGGSGSYSRKRVTAADIAASKAVTIGAGGTAGSTAGGNGGTGGDASIGTLVIAKGGSGGTGSTKTTKGGDANNGGVGGIAGTGDVALEGSDGGPGYALFETTGAGFFFVGGYGAGSYFGGGATSAGNAGGTNTGAGGSGAAAVAAAQAGGAGAKGLCIATEYNTQ